MLLASIRPSVVLLTLLNWPMGGNSSTLTLSQQCLPRLECGYLLILSWQTVVMNGSHWEGVHVKVEAVRPLPVFDKGVRPERKRCVFGIHGRIP